MTLFWWGLCLDNLPLSKFLSLPLLPAALSPPPPPPCQAYFINGSSWRSFSGIQGLLPFGVLISPDAWNTEKTLLETITIQAGTVDPFRTQMVVSRRNRRLHGAQHITAAGSPWPQRVDWKAVNRGWISVLSIEGASHDFATHLSSAPLNCWIWICDQPELPPLKSHGPELIRTTMVGTLIDMARWWPHS